MIGHLESPHPIGTTHGVSTGPDAGGRWCPVFEKVVSFLKGIGHGGAVAKSMRFIGEIQHYMEGDVA